jgi:hypothetical protein
MTFILSVPSAAASTSRRNNAAMASATTAMTATMTTKVRLPPDKESSALPSAARVRRDIRYLQGTRWFHSWVQTN